jgi:succinate dehydrogenase / fumarate reductase, membrane anchor subunit
MANNTENYGPHRLVVGAHYGTADWVAQRATAILMAIYTIVLLVAFFSSGNIGYESWAGLFSHQWFKVLSFATLAGLFYHAWVGMRNVWMDYIKPVGLRLTLQVATIAWLVGCASWAAQILWKV